MSGLARPVTLNRPPRANAAAFPLRPNRRLEAHTTHRVRPPPPALFGALATRSRFRFRRRIGSGSGAPLPRPGSAAAAAASAACFVSTSRDGSGRRSAKPMTHFRQEGGTVVKGSSGEGRKERGGVPVFWPLLEAY